jgi:hypothetical protein
MNSRLPGGLYISVTACYVPHNLSEVEQTDTKPQCGICLRLGGVTVQVGESTTALSGIAPLATEQLLDSTDLDNVEEAFVPHHVSLTAQDWCQVELWGTSMPSQSLKTPAAHHETKLEAPAGLDMSGHAL